MLQELLPRLCSRKQASPACDRRNVVDCCLQMVTGCARTMCLPCPSSLRTETHMSYGSPLMVKARTVSPLTPSVNVTCAGQGRERHGCMRCAEPALLSQWERLCAANTPLVPCHVLSDCQASCGKSGVGGEHCPGRTSCPEEPLPCSDVLRLLAYIERAAVWVNEITKYCAPWTSCSPSAGVSVQQCMHLFPR